MTKIPLLFKNKILILNAVTSHDHNHRKGRIVSILSTAGVTSASTTLILHYSIQRFHNTDHEFSRESDALLELDQSL